MQNEQTLQPAKPIGSSLARRRWFMLALLFSTWLPMLFFIAVGQAQNLTGGINTLRSLLLFLGTAHVPATLYFYVDREFAPIVRANRARYVYAPILLAIATGIIFTVANSQMTAFVLLGYWAWQAFHYGRQNVGIYAFVSIAEGRTANRNEKLAIDLATVAGILGTFKVLGAPVAPPFLQGTLSWLYGFGRVAFILAILFGVFVYAINIRNSTLLKSIFFFTLILFFGPIYLSENVNIGFLSYAIAHGIQYIIFMSIVSANSASESDLKFPYRNVFLFLVLLLLVGFIFWRAADLRLMSFVQNRNFLLHLVDFITGAILGATMAHFVIDAGAWKLSQVAQRTYMSKRFGFLFAPQSTPANVKQPLEIRP
jgi:hypothetical protein